MKNIILLFFSLFCFLSFSQAPPQGVNYQAVLYDISSSELPGVDANDLILANQEITVRFTILANTSTGTEVYKETHSTTTDSYGLFSLVIGQGTQVSTDLFEEINWGTGLHFLEVEVDKNGGSNFIVMSNQQIWSVPYALYSKYAGNGIESVLENQDGTVTFTYFDGTNTIVGPFGWALAGNVATNDSVNFIGTKDSQDLVIKTNDQERARFTDLGEFKIGINGQKLYMNTQGQFGINTTNIDPSALLELKSPSRGFLPPRMTFDQRNNIPNPAQGLIVFNTTDSVMEFFNGECWLPTYAESCDDCFFDLTLPFSSGNIDRVISDTIAIEILIDQTGTTTQTVTFFAVQNLPPMTSTYFTSDTLSGDGSTFLVVSTSIFDNPGMYPIAIQAVCGNTIRVEIFYLTIDSCYQVTINNNVSQYNLQSFNNLPGVGTPICVVLDVATVGTINSNSASIPSYTSGALDPQSHVGIRNYGAFMAHGGDGGVGGSLSTFGNPGQNGGNAINMTTKTSFINNGYIYGGGGGGGSVGFGQSFNIPFIGTWTLAIGAGGGGGCSLGAGGGTGGAVIGFWDNGQSATGGLNAIPGDGGELDVPININIAVATLTINPNVLGGDGGGYGYSGNSGQLTVGVSVTVPIIGTINLPIPAINGFPAGGSGGYAIKANSNSINGIPLGNFQNNNLRGIVNN